MEQIQSSVSMPNAAGRFGEFGGRFVPETLMPALLELEEAYNHFKNDPDFQAELKHYLREYVGRPNPLYFAERLTAELGGAQIYLKREDLNHTGAHKINNTIGQILLAKRMGRDELLQKQEPGNTGLQPLLFVLNLTSSAKFLWVKKMCGANRSMFFGCA